MDTTTGAARLDALGRRATSAAQGTLRSRSESPVPTHDGVRVRAASLFSSPPQPLVLDANFLRDEIIRISKFRNATYLVTAAAVGGVRLYCAPHVAEEVEEHLEEWAAISHVDADLARIAWENTHQRLLVVVKPDAEVEFGLAEVERLHVLATSKKKEFGDPDDVPTAQLALTLRAPVLSKDVALLRAVYGHDHPTGSHRDWLKQFGALAELQVLGEIRQGAALTTGLAAMGTYHVVRRNPVLALAAVATFIVALNPSQRRALADAATKGIKVVVAYLIELEAAMTEARRLAALLPAPPDEEPADLSVRGLAATVARRPDGAAPVTDLLDLEGRASTPKQVASRLCDSPLFVQTTPGVVQLGLPLNITGSSGNR